MGFAGFIHYHQNYVNLGTVLKLETTPHKYLQNEVDMAKNHICKEHQLGPPKTTLQYSTAIRRCLQAVLYALGWRLGCATDIRKEPTSPTPLLQPCS